MRRAPFALLPLLTLHVHGCIEAKLGDQPFACNAGPADWCPISPVKYQCVYDPHSDSPRRGQSCEAEMNGTRAAQTLQCYPETHPARSCVPACVCKRSGSAPSADGGESEAESEAESESESEAESEGADAGPARCGDHVCAPPDNGLLSGSYRTDTSQMNTPIAEGIATTATILVPDMEDGHSTGHISGAAITGGVTARMRVSVTIEHPHVEQLAISLVPPASVAGGAPIQLVRYSNPPASPAIRGANMTGTIFDDTADQSIVNGAAPYSDRAGYKPMGNFHALVGQPMAGNWTLSIQDNVSDGSSGFLRSWRLAITYEEDCTSCPADCMPCGM